MAAQAPAGAPAGSNSTFLSPGGPYFVLVSGTIQRQSNPVLAEGLSAAGAVGFPTMDLATAFAHSQVHTPAGLVQQAGASVVNDALKPLFQAQIWLRVAEVVAGLVLIAIGLNSMMKGRPLSVVSSTAGLAAKVVPA